MQNGVPHGGSLRIKQTQHTREKRHELINKDEPIIATTRPHTLLIPTTQSAPGRQGIPTASQGERIHIQRPAPTTRSIKTIHGPIPVGTDVESKTGVRKPRQSKDGAEPKRKQQGGQKAAI